MTSATRRRWHERFSVGQRVEVETFLHGKSQWHAGVVRSVPRKREGLEWLGWSGAFVVVRDPLPGHTCGSEIEVTRARGVRAIGGAP